MVSLSSLTSWWSRVLLIIGFLFTVASWYCAMLVGNAGAAWLIHGSGALPYLALTLFYLFIMIITTSIASGFIRASLDQYDVVEWTMFKYLALLLLVVYGMVAAAEGSYFTSLL